MDLRTTKAGVRPLLPAEVRATVQLYLDGLSTNGSAPMRPVTTLIFS